MSGRFYCEATVSLSSGKTFRRFSTLRWFWKTTPRRLCKQQHWAKWAPSARRSAAPSARRLRWNAARSELGITFVVSRPAGIGNPGRAEASCFHSGLMVHNVQDVQAAATPSFILPRDAGEERGGGLNVLNCLNDLNKKLLVTSVNVDV